MNFEDAQGNLIYGDLWDAQPCIGKPVLYSYLLPGTYKVYVDATGSGSARYLSSESQPAVGDHPTGRVPRRLGAAGFETGSRK